MDNRYNPDRYRAAQPSRSYSQEPRGFDSDETAYGRTVYRSRLQRASPPPTLRRRASFEDFLDDLRMTSRTKRIPSPPRDLRYSRRRVPSLPPTNRHRFSFGDLPTRFPRTPPSPYPIVTNEYLSPPDESRYSAAADDRSLKLKYRRNERAPSPRVPLPSTRTPDAVRLERVSIPLKVLSEDATPEPSEARSTKRHWSREAASSVGLSSSPSRPPLSRSASTGTLGDKVYRYTTLRALEFRLVRILPQRKLTIKCQIVHTSLQDPPRYVAISYAWGDAGDTRKILLEGTSIPVPVSLYGALEALRRRAETALVWVDALCINQQNKDERSQQVQLMTSIYSKAESVAIWLGPEADNSLLAIDLLKVVADRANTSESITDLIASPARKHEFAAVVSLFERDYWGRLWVVQEVLNAKAITVYCGSTSLPWTALTRASDTFRQHKSLLDSHFPAGSTERKYRVLPRSQFTYSQVLVHQGPGSFPDFGSFLSHAEGSLLEVLRSCRRKLATDDRDKVFGLLGILPQEVREEFPPDYNLSVKEVYTDVVDYLLTTTRRLDVICEAIHFPFHTNSANLPTFVPEWSHIPETAALGQQCRFSAADKTDADFRFVDERRNKLEISAIYLDTIESHGVAVGTLCTLADCLMAFLHWRALLIGSLDTDDEHYSLSIQEEFCRTLCLGQVPEVWDKPRQWLKVVYHLFASFTRERLPHLPLDGELQSYLDAKVDIDPSARRRFVQDHFAQSMMGRCFCLTVDGRMGMGSGFMTRDDVVVVPLGCDTPILIRPEGHRGEYRFVGDVYVNFYMDGKAVRQLNDGERKVTKYVLH